ncbi:MAG: Gfo/Idh/MocA family oxidoreductase [Acidobacteriota bacterium]|nr:Gfo/Idh/MocA family oxidoreductase [Acidobacteriota bacterium]
MSAPIRTAVLGFGLAGKIFHCPFISAVPGFELTTIVQRRGDEASAAYPDARILRSADEAFNDPNLDLIIVATPNDTHFDLAARALQAGKHVVLDKPFTTTSAQARSLIDIAKHAGKILAPFHNRRYDGDFLTVRKLRAESVLGRIVTIESHLDRFRPIQRANTWKESSGPANGLLFDLGPHLVDQALALFGPPASVTASVRSDRDETAIEDAFILVLDYGGSADNRYVRYTCHATMLAAEPAPRFTVHGTHGSYTKRGIDPQEPALHNGAKVPPLDAPTPWLPEPKSAWGTLTHAPNPSDPTHLIRAPYPTETGDYRQFYVNVRDAILGTTPLAIPAEDGYRTIRILELARISSERRITIDITFD